MRGSNVCLSMPCCDRKYALTVYPWHAGIYNETAFRGLDFVLDQAAQYGVKVMFTLANNWKTFDSKYNVRSPPCRANNSPASRRGMKIASLLENLPIRLVHVHATCLLFQDQSKSSHNVCSSECYA